jgi:elongation factor 2
MPRFRHIANILSLMGKKESIRNLGILAHIDHGKTTLTDSLLAGTGLLSPQVAGSARVLDYLEEEQKRGITLKTANISMLYQKAQGSFVINLVDTPGHVDFTGKVTRALRTIDGAVVLVDAVEEIMAQTELVMRQALEERVRPVLFINKVDRLITELKLTEEQIQEKFNRIIGVFNDLIEIYGESPFKEKWKANALKGNVVFGSALHRWGFTLEMAQQSDMKFSDVMNAYGKEEFERLRELFPLHAAILGMAVEHVPNPREAQRYRVEKIWKGNPASDIGRALVRCEDEGPAVFCVTNVQSEAESGLIATGRVFSGTVKTSAKVFLANAQTEHVIKEVSVYMGAFRERVDQVPAGNLAALGGLEMIKAGETVVATENEENMIPFERIKYISEPVVTVAVEPDNPLQLSELLRGMNQLSTEDPNLNVSVNKDTGECLLSGMGELHLEIAVKQLQDILSGIKITVSSPRVVYREKITEKGIIAVASSPNRLNKFTLQAEPLDEESVRTFMEENHKTGNGEDLLAVDEYGNVLVDSITKPGLVGVLDFVVSGFRFACKAGPLCGEPMRGTKLSLMEIQLSDSSDQYGPVEIMRGVGKAIFGSFLTAKPVLLEPISKTVVSSPVELAGECTKIISGRRGRISAFEQKGAFTVITSFVPVAETFGLSKQLRSASSGRAFWQSVFDHWEKVPEKLSGKGIAEVRKKKGLPSEIPRAERFLEEIP